MGQQSKASLKALKDASYADNDNELIVEGTHRTVWEDAIDSVPFLNALNTYTAQQRWNKGADVASATALNIGTDGNYFDVTGTTTVTSITDMGGAGAVVILQFDAALTFTHHATDLILPGGANITTAAGDHAIMVNYASGDWRCVGYFKADGKAVVVDSIGMSDLSDYNASSNKIINVTNPTSAQDAATKNYVDNAIDGLKYKSERIVVATTANITLSGEQTIDGVLTSSSRVLVWQQTDQTENGIYDSNSSTWTRTSDGDSADELISAVVIIGQGSTYGDTEFVCTNDSITIGATNIVWVQRATGSGMSDLVDDTSPQLGGILDTNSNQVRWSNGSDVASATALSVGTDGNYYRVTGTTNIESIDAMGGDGTVIILRFSDSLTLVHNVIALDLPGGANITTAAGDHAIMVNYAIGNWRCISYSRADGTTPLATVYDTQDFSVGAFITNITNGGEAGSREVGSNKIMTDYIAFDKDTDEYAQWDWVLPEQTISDPTLRFKFYLMTQTGAATNLVFGVQYIILSNDEAVDQSWSAASVCGAVTMTTTDDLYISDGACNITLTDMSAGDKVVFRVFRDTSADNHATDGELTKVVVQYPRNNTAGTVWS